MKTMRRWQIEVLGIVALGGLANLAAGQDVTPPVGTSPDPNPYTADPYVYGFYNAVPFMAPTPQWYGVRPIQPPTAYGPLSPDYAPRSHRYGRQPHGYNRAPYNYGADPYAYGRSPVGGQAYHYGRSYRSPYGAFDGYADRGRVYGYADDFKSYGTRTRQRFDERPGDYGRAAEPYTHRNSTYGYQSPYDLRGGTRLKEYAGDRRSYAGGQTPRASIAEQFEEARDRQPTDVQTVDPNGQRIGDSGYVEPPGDREESPRPQDPLQ